MLYSMHTNSKPATGKTGKKIMKAAAIAQPIANKAAKVTITHIVAARKLRKADATQAEVC